MHDLELSLLGGLEVTSDAVAGAPLARKARGLLAYLALHPRQAQSREKLAALFWSGIPEAQARMNLRQALSGLRKALSSADGVHLLTAGDHISLDLNGLAIDVERFEALVEQSTTDSLEQALALYRGDLLDGFSLKEEAFEEWIVAERVRLRLRAIDALEKLIADYRAKQDHARWLRAAVRLLTLDPLREDIHREIIRIHAAQGHLSSAVKQYETCRDILLRELGVQPEAETQKLFQEIRKRRERSVASPVSLTSTKHDPTPDQTGYLPLPAGPSVAVLPFANASDDPEQAYFANGITENIITGLTRFRELFVIAFTSSRLARDRSVDAVEIGRQLGVANLLEGSVRRAGGRVRVTAQLIDASSGHRIWAEQYDRSVGDIFLIQDEITGLIVATLPGHIEEASRQRSGQKPPGDLAAYDYLLRARQCMRRGTMQSELAARSHLERAIDLDPKYAAAYAALALNHIYEYESPWSEDPQSAAKRAFELAQKAVEFDKNDSIAHRALAYAAHHRGEIDLAKKEIHTAVALNPNDYSNLCVKAWILNLSGQPEAALDCRDQSLRINPFSPDNCLLDVGVAQYSMQRYEESAESFGQMSSWDLLRYACLAACLAQLGQNAEAHAATARALELVKAEYAGRSGDAIQNWLGYVKRMFRFAKQDDWNHLLAGFRMAGMPL